MGLPILHNNQEDRRITATFTFIIFTTRCYTLRGYAVPHVVCPSVCPSVTFRYRDNIGWNTPKIISQPNNLSYLLTLNPKSAIWSNGNTPKIRVE